MSISNKKRQERVELHRTIWNIANDLRGSGDRWDFKQHVLGILSYRYIYRNNAQFFLFGVLPATSGRKLFSCITSSKKPLIVHLIDFASMYQNDYEDNYDKN